MVKIHFIDGGIYDIPEYPLDGSSAMDLYANNFQPNTIAPGERALIGTGLRLIIPRGYEAQIRPRGGLSLTHGITVLNSPGAIDSEWKGEVQVILYNAGDRPFTVRRGDKIAQLVFSKYERVKLIESY